MSVNYIPAGHEDDFSDEDNSFEDAFTRELKITVVPAITTGAGINGQDFDAKLTAEESIWFEQFKGTYHTYKQKPTAQHQIKLLLVENAQPLQLALKLFANCPDCNSLKKNSLAIFIMETVCAIYKNRSMNDASIQKNNTNCDDNTRMVAFNFMRTCSLVNLQKAVIQTYELHKIKHLLISKLQQLLNEGHCKEVANWCILLNLTNLFGLYDLILPLILQDRISLAEDYLMKANELQLPTVQYLDSLLDKKRTVYEHCDGIIKEHKYKNVKMDFLTHRPMCKLVTRLAKKFHIDMHYTPNLEYSKSSSYLHYLFHKYKAEGMSLESWRELARDEAYKNRSLQLDLVAYIAQYDHNLEEALYWVKIFNIALEECPEVVQVQIQTQPSRYIVDNNQDNKSLLNNSNLNIVQEVMSNERDDSRGKYENEISEVNNDHYQPPRATSGYIAIVDKRKKKDHFQHRTTSGYMAVADGDGTASMATQRPINNAEEYLTLPLPMDKVLWIDDSASFLQMLTYLESHNHIAFDSEWKPGVHSSTYGVSLLQLATRDRVYLIDCLSENLYHDLWISLGVKIFNNLEILKIGFSINQDITMLHKSIPAIQLNFQLISSYIDLRDLWHRLKYKLNFKFPYESDYIKGEGLSALTQLCFGKKLNKSNQCSNWSKRPLRYDQIAYAALDVYSLISIYHAIAELLSEVNINIDAVIEQTPIKTNIAHLNFRKKPVDLKANNGQTAVTKNCKHSGNPNKKEAHNINWQQLQSQQTLCLKFLCDFMLYGLTTELRKLGLDCLQMFPVADLNSYIELAKREQYTVLSRGLHYHVFCRTLTQTQCLQIDEDTLDNQVIKLLQYLNIQINQKDLYSRCVKCNHNEFILATSEQFLYMCDHKLDEHDCNDINLRTLKYTSDIIREQQEQRSWKLHCMTKKILKMKKTKYGKSIQLTDIDIKRIKNNEYYYICNNCGICTWDGDYNINSNIISYLNHHQQFSKV